MNRRLLCYCSTVAILFVGITASRPQVRRQFSATALGSPTLPAPISIYDNWSTYDELSDHVPLTQDLAMRELDQMLRLKKAGVRFDYYAMDAFWFAPDGAYRTWKKPNWPDGPEPWITKCLQNGIRPGLWFSSNTLVHLNAPPQWRDSLNRQGTAMSMFEGGFLPDFMKTLQFWYDHGVRMFLFDFADLTAATPHAEATMTKQEIVRRNTAALRDALAAFRHSDPDVVLEALNGFGGVMDSTFYRFPFKDPIDLNWLKVFDVVYCGDPRPADVPEMNFWRSVDLYSDHQDRRYQQAGVPLERIDTTSFMPGNTGTIYRRGFQAWKGSLLLMLARGGWLNTTYGNLEQLSDADVAWFARVQSLFLHLQSTGRTQTFGGIPGEDQPYGFGSLDADGSVYVVVNPKQETASIALPLLAPDQEPLVGGRMQFRDAGFVPLLTANSVELGPGQMAMVSYGKYATSAYDLGVQQDVVIPRSIQPISADFKSIGKGIVQAVIPAPADGDLRIIVQQYASDGAPLRTFAGDTSMGKVFQLQAEQNGQPLPIHEDYDRVIWSGLSWAAGEVAQKDLQPHSPLTLTIRSTENSPVTLRGSLYRVRY
ncbi:MAG TPA: hypothetical protein VFE06_09165 [Acidobacteriaceae bacterium]|jgi:hypothetical protein|nr:hypothetical protein [Acidobacteriaceae bacterium]